MKSLRIVFAGTPEFGIPCLEAIQDSPHTVVGVLTQPDRPAGRGRKSLMPAVGQWATNRAIPVEQPPTLKGPDAPGILEAWKPDIMVVIAYGLLLPAPILAFPPLGCINVHASLLPRWRGASPIQQAVLHGDNTSGISIMQMDKGLDTGPVLNIAECPLSSTDTAADLHDRLAVLAPALLMETLNMLAAGTATPRPQDNARATLAPKIGKDDARIDWTRPADQIVRQVHAFNPWPVAWTDLAGSRIRIFRAQAQESGTTGSPGQVLEVGENGLIIAAGEGAVRVEELQLPGGRVLSARAWFHGAHGGIAPGMFAG